MNITKGTVLNLVCHVDPVIRLGPPKIFLCYNNKVTPLQDPAQPMETNAAELAAVLIYSGLFLALVGLV